MKKYYQRTTECSQLEKMDLAEHLKEKIAFIKLRGCRTIKEEYLLLKLEGTLARVLGEV